jgi:hypothetical protein
VQNSKNKQRQFKLIWPDWSFSRATIFLFIHYSASAEFILKLEPFLMPQVANNTTRFNTGKEPINRRVLTLFPLSQTPVWQL